jgi:putative transposase
LNPVRARLVDKPEDCLWSSYRANTFGEHNPLLCPHTLYRARGNNAPERQCGYRKLFAAHLDPDMLRDLRSCLQTGTPLGNDRFRAQNDQALGEK